MEDKLLWIQLLQGNKKAFDVLFRKYYPALKAYGMKIAGKEQFVQEAIQLLFLKIWERRDSLDRAVNLKAYLLTAYRRTLIDLLQEEKKRENSVTQIPMVFLEDEFEFTEGIPVLATEEVHAILAQLNDYQKEIIYLKFYNNLSYKEIATVLGINYQTVRNYMSKAISALRKKIKKDKKK